MQREDLKDLSREQLERLICDWAVKYYDSEEERIRVTRERDTLIDERNNLLKNSDIKESTNRLIFNGGATEIWVASGTYITSTGNGLSFKVKNNDGYTYNLTCTAAAITFSKTDSNESTTTIWTK